MMERLMILTADLLFDGGTDPHYFATQQYYSKAGDSIGVRAYNGRISGTPTYSIRVSTVIHGATPTTGYGALELVNTDGALNDFVRKKARDCLCILRLGYQGDSFDDFTVVARVVMDSVEMGTDTIRISLRGQDTRLDRPLQPDVYPDSLANEQLRGTPKPITIGDCIQIEPPQTNPTTLSYDVSDYGPVNIFSVYSGGSPADGPLDSPAQWEYNATQSGFSMNIPAAARVTTDLSAPKGGLSDILSGIGEFNIESNWTGNTPDGWSKIQNPPGSEITRIDAGARIVYSVSASASLTTLTDVLPDTDAGWYMVTGRIAKQTSLAGLGVRFRNTGTVFNLTEEGEFCKVIYVEAGANRTIRIGSPGAVDGEIVVDSIYIYKIQNVTVGNDLYDVLWPVLIRGGMTEANLDVSVITRPGQSWILTPPVGYHQKDSTTARQAVNQIMAAVTGWLYVAPDGKVRVGTLETPTGSPDVRCSTVNVTTWPIYQPDLAPNLSDTYTAGKVFSPYTEEELAGITHTDQPPFIADYRHKMKGVNTLDRFYRHAVGADPVPTLLVDALDAQIEADRITDDFSRQRGFWTFGIVLGSPQEAVALLPGATAELERTLFGRNEEDDQLGQIVGVEGQFGMNTLQITVRV
jgi:hypothetical protein